MPRIFCLSCNAASEYLSERPKFCGKCGKPYISNSNSSFTSIPANITKTQKQTILDDEIDGNIQVPNIEKMEYEVKGDLRPNRESAKNVIGAGALGIKRPHNKVKKISKKDFEKEWQEQFQKGTKNSPISLGE